MNNKPIDLSQYPLGTKFKHINTGDMYTVMRTLDSKTLKPTYYLYSRDMDLPIFNPTEEFFILAQST